MKLNPYCPDGPHVPHTWSNEYGLPGGWCSGLTFTEHERREQMRDHHAPAPDVDLTSVRSPGGEPWARTDRLLAGPRERRAVLEQQIREDQQHQDALRVEAWAAGLTHKQDRLIAAAAADVIRGRR